MKSDLDFRLFREENSRSLSMVILAGGRSSRMGTDKSDLVYKEQTFLEIQIEKGRKLGIEDILVSGYRGLKCSAQVIMDRIENRGPLGGLEACFCQAKHGRSLVLSVDVPLVSVQELQGLIEKNRKSSDLITVLSHRQKQEPLIGIYSTDLAGHIEKFLSERNGSVFAFLRSIGYGEYKSEGEEFQFQNINEKADYRRLQRQV